jgi:acyl-CoA dehydrogenase
VDPLGGTVFTHPPAPRHLNYFMASANRTGHWTPSSLVEGGRPGLEARRIETLGWRTSHTGELSFDGARGELLREEGRGFGEIMRCFVWERISMALAAVSAAHRTLEQAVAYARVREAFGRPVARF